MTIEFVLAEYRVKEDGTWLTERPSIIRTGGTGACSVKVSNSSSSTIAGRGTRDKDYTAVSSTTVSFADGETGIKYIDFQIIQDTLDEPDEYIPLSLSSVSGETLGAIKSSKVTILDDDEPAPPVPILVKQIENIGLRQANLAGYGLENSKVFCVDVNTSLPKGRELLIGTDISQHLKEIILPPNDSKFPFRQINLFTDWGTPANTYFYLFLGEIEDFVCASPSNPNNIVVCPTAILNSRVNSNKNTAIVGDNRIWVASDTPNTPMRLFISVEDYSTNWFVQSVVKHTHNSVAFFSVS